MSRERTWSLLIHTLLVVSVLVEGSPVVTSPKPSDATAALKTKDVPFLAPNQKEDARTTKTAFENYKSDAPKTHKIDVTTTLKPGSQTTKGRNGHEQPGEFTTKNPTSIGKIPFQPSLQKFPEPKMASGTAQTTQHPTTHNNQKSTTKKHNAATHPPSRIQKKSSPIHITRIYQMKKQIGYSCKKEHNVKLQVGEGRYLNIQITED